MAFKTLGPAYLNWVAIVCTAVLAPILSGCGPGYTPEELAEATAQVREAFRLEDYEYGAELGEAWSARAPDALELNAWTVAHLARAYWGDPVAYPKAQEMAAAHPESPWSSFAIGAARTWTYPREYADEALAATERALAGLPEDVGVALLRTQALEYYQDKEAALQFLDGLPEEMKIEPDVRVEKGRLLEPAREERTEQALLPLLAMYEEILAENPNHLAAMERAEFMHYALGNPAEQRRLSELAATLTPSTSVHDNYWYDIDRDTTLTQEEKNERIAADVHRVLEGYEPSPGRWAVMAENLYYVNQWDLQAELEDRVLREYPDSWAVESVLGTRMTVLGYDVIGEPVFDEEKAAAQRAKYVDLIEQFLARGEYRKLDFLWDAYWDLFLIKASDPGPDPQQLSELAHHWSKLIHPVSRPFPELYFTHGARILAEYEECLEDARQFVEMARSELNERQGEEDPYSRLEMYRAMLSAVQALVHIQGGQLDAAEEELAKASDVDPESPAARSVLPLADLYYGRLMERRADLARSNGNDGEAQSFLRLAEESYQQGLRSPYRADLYRGMPFVNPNEAALEIFYQKTHGNLEGFEAYIATAKDEGWEVRHDSILAERLPDPRPMEPFTLETLADQEVRSDQFLGQVVIINFWGTW